MAVSTSIRVRVEDLTWILGKLSGDITPPATRIREEVLHELSQPKRVCCSTYEQYLERHS